jgi:hypothetical protein
MRNEDVREAREDHTVTTTKRFLDEKERTTKHARICEVMTVIEHFVAGLYF